MAVNRRAEDGRRQSRHAHLSTPHASWNEVAGEQKAIDKIADKFFELPIEEFRKFPYKPSELPHDAPEIGTDIIVEETEVVVRDGTAIPVRIYKPLGDSPNRLLFFHTHGGGISPLISYEFWLLETWKAVRRIACIF